MPEEFSKDLLNNTVSARDQLDSDQYVCFTRVEQPAKRVLFIGNSTARHGVAPHLGWLHDWGMAASDISKDYVHVTADLLAERFGPISFCIAQCAVWEREYWSTAVLEEHYKKARDFGADIIIARLGGNADREKFGEHDFSEGFADMIRFFDPAGRAQIIVADMFWESPKIDGLIRKACDDNGWEFVHIGDLGAMDEMKAIGQFEHPGVAAHPGDKGMATMARRFFDAVCRLNP